MIWRTSLDACYGYVRGIFKRAGEYRFIFAGICILFARYRYHAARDSILIERCFLIRSMLLIVFSRPIECKTGRGESNARRWPTRANPELDKHPIRSPPIRDPFLPLENVRTKSVSNLNHRRKLEYRWIPLAWRFFPLSMCAVFLIGSPFFYEFYT